jgi:hypothetical protein
MYDMTLIIRCSSFRKGFIGTQLRIKQGLQELMHNLLLEGKCRNESIEDLKMFYLQMQLMTNEYTACGFFSLNLSLFASVVSGIVSYIIIMAQIK